jgi:hypothetical protein
MFIDVGCASELSEQLYRKGSPPNYICRLPGSTTDTIIVGAHFDSNGPGVADNWSGAVALSLLYQCLSDGRLRHTFLFVGFSEEEKGLLGSRAFVKRLSKEQRELTHAMINLDVLGLGMPVVWNSHSDVFLVRQLAIMSKSMGHELTGIDIETSVRAIPSP